MQSLRRAATRASLTSAITTAAATSAAPRTQSISFALRSANALRCFSVAAPRAFFPSARLGDENQSPPQQQENQESELGEGLAHVPPPSQHCIFVHNYSFDVSREEMFEAFSKFGDVLQIDMPPRKSYCFIYFKTGESVNLAIDNVNNTFWHGRRLTVKLSPPKSTVVKSQRHVRNVRAAEPGPPTRTLYIGNISFDATDVELNELFSSLKNVKDVRVAVDKATGWPRGFAHADFFSVEDAQVGLDDLKEKSLRGRPLRVGFAGKTRKGNDDRQSENQDLVDSEKTPSEQLNDAMAEKAAEEKKNQTMDWNA